MLMCVYLKSQYMWIPHGSLNCKNKCAAENLHTGLQTSGDRIVHNYI